MALVYFEQPDGSVSALEDDLLVVLWPRSEVEYALEVWLGEEVPAYKSVAATLEKAKEKVHIWLSEALT